MGSVSAIKIGIFAILIIGIVGMSSCSKTSDAAAFEDYEIALQWSDMTLYITKNTPQNSPTYASRCIGYIGLVMYESVVHGAQEYQSISDQLNNLHPLPKPEKELTYDWRLSFSAGQAAILTSLYQQTSDENKAKIDSLERVIFDNIKKTISDRQLINRSVAYGKSIASAIFEWSKEDGGHRGYLKNFDREYVHSEHPGSWKPPLYAQSFSHHPLHPHWGKNRTFLKENAELDIPYMIPFDTLPSSDYYLQFEEVYEKDLVLTQEEKEIAIWWGDDPDDTFTPPGHSFYLASLLIKDQKPDLFKCSATYAHVGLAVADAFINCWKWKYHYFSERPNTFIPKYIDEQWESFWPDPPFPTFPSGHAIQAASAACTLMDLYDNNTQFIDRAHVGRERDKLRNTDFKERSFTSIWGIAIETANSRFYGGIHVQQDNDVGITEGIRIAENVNDLNWKK